MAVKSELCPEDMQNIIRDYSIGGFCGYSPVSRGTVQTVFVIRTGKAKYFLKYYENRPVKSVLFESCLINYLVGKNYSCPVIVKNKRGKSMGIYRGKPFLMFEFAEGAAPEKLSRKQNQLIIEKAAELQNLTKKYRPVYKDFRWNYNVRRCREVAEQEAKKLGTEEAKKKLIWHRDELEKLVLPKNLPRGICHCDLSDFAGNVFFQNGKVSAVLDFDDANYTYLAFDLVYLIYPFIGSFDHDTWQNFKNEDNVFDFNESRRTVNEYSRYRELSSNEKRHLFDMYKLGILFDCVWYFKRGRADDFYEKKKIDYLNRLGADGFYRGLFG